MKVKQIVGEHKKGVRAMKYTKKPQNTIAPKKPAKQTIKPGDKVDEDITATQGKIVANDGKTITVGLPDGTQIQKPIANALGKDPQTGAPVFNVATAQSPTTMGQPQQDPAQATAAGQEISVNTGEPVEDQQMGESHMSEIAAMYDDWMSSEDAPFDDMAGDDNAVYQKAREYLFGRVAYDKVNDIAEILTRHFNGDVDEGHNDIGGDPTDEYIKDVEMQEGQPTTLANPNDPTSKGQIEQEINADTTIDNETKEQLKAAFKYDADGTINVKASVVPMMQQFTDGLPYLADFCNKLADMIEQAVSQGTDPEWTKLTPKQQHEAIANVPQLRQSAAKIMATIPQLQQQTQQMSQLPNKPAPLRTAAAPMSPEVKESLEAMLRIAGLR